MTTPTLTVALILSVAVWLIGFATLSHGGRVGRAVIGLAERINPVPSAATTAADGVAAVDRLAAEGHLPAAAWAGLSAAWSTLWTSDEPGGRDRQRRLARPRNWVGTVAAASVTALVLAGVIAAWRIGRWVAAGLAWPLVVPLLMAAGLAWMVRTDRHRAAAENDVDALTGGDDRDVVDGGAGAAAPVHGVASEPTRAETAGVPAGGMDPDPEPGPDLEPGPDPDPDPAPAAAVIEVHPRRGGDAEPMVRLRLESGSAEFLRRGPIDLMLLNWTGRAAEVLVCPSPSATPEVAVAPDGDCGHPDRPDGELSTIEPGERRAMVRTEIGAVQITNLGPAALALAVTLIDGVEARPLAS
ncbi:MAG: hypothetical protein ACK5PP_07255 [Acidimicrobiales bacterium]